MAGLWLALLSILSFASLAHTVKADIFLDDFLFRLTVAELAHPTDLFTGRHFFVEHLHRPVGLLSWWLVERWGQGPRGQYLLTAVLLAGLAGVVWVAHPSSAAGASWPSDRFDLLAASFGCWH